MKNSKLQVKIQELRDSIHKEVEKRGYEVVQTSEGDIETTIEHGSCIQISIMYEYKNPETGKKLVNLKKQIILS